MKYWLAYADLDGFRLDAVKHITDDFVAFFSTEVSTRDCARSVPHTRCN
jgi:glycosidase